MHRPKATLAVRYADQNGASALFADPGQILGVVGYGAARPNTLAPGCPFIAAPLLPISGSPAFEIWTASAPALPCQLGPVTGACSSDLVFGSIQLAETNGVPLEDAVEQAYLAIFSFLAQTGFNEPIRFWNYLTAITAEEHGQERYRHFNTGRQRAFLARLRQPVPPAASCLGAYHGTSMIYFLAAREMATPVENPRQVSAYAYPPLYGPTSPSFSRAAWHGQNNAKTLFISGTASIVGHETRHRGDLPSQIAETLENLRALITEAGLALAKTQPEDWALKIYLRDPLYHAAAEPALNAMFGAASQRLYLHAEICRPDLLIEIEALNTTGAGEIWRGRPRGSAPSCVCTPSA